jgi:hypothetical protein
MFDGLIIEAELLMEQVLASEAAVDAILHWRQESLPEGYRENDESTHHGATYEAKSIEFRALFHRVDHRLSGFTRFMEIRTGDVILEYMEDLDLATKPDARIQVGDEFFVQKNASRELLEAWEVSLDQGRGLFRTLLLTPAG